MVLESDEMARSLLIYTLTEAKKIMQLTGIDIQQLPVYDIFKVNTAQGYVYFKFQNLSNFSVCKL